MADIAIQVDGIGKAYRIGVNEQRHETMFGAVAAFVKSPFSNFRNLRNLSRFDSLEAEDVFWALKDVSFELKQGDVVGIIGRNGAGKSTLLKILSRITEPTCGGARVFGRVGSLLEVGTGFHPDLTGRENVYLNGTILGMKKREIARKFDEIIEFSGIERFIDTPVKRYSSGMRVRLAFSVAAHLEPEILIVDEVLAVGDAEFQRKCLGQMKDVAKSGRTVLFVSHNMAAVRSLCTRGILLAAGTVSYDGPVSEAVHRYNNLLVSQDFGSESEVVSFSELFVGSDRNGAIEAGEAFEIRCRMRILQPIPRFRLLCIMHDGEGETILHAETDSNRLNMEGGVGVHTVTLQVPALWLKSGVYSVHFKLLAESATLAKSRFVSGDRMLDVSSAVPQNWGPGLLSPPLGWDVRPEEQSATWIGSWRDHT